MPSMHTPNEAHDRPSHVTPTTGILRQPEATTTAATPALRMPVTLEPEAIGATPQPPATGRTPQATMMDQIHQYEDNERIHKTKQFFKRSAFTKDLQWDNTPSKIPYHSFAG